MFKAGTYKRLSLMGIRFAFRYMKFSLCDDAIGYCVKLHEYLQRRDGEDTDITEVRIRTLISDPIRDCLGYAVRRLETKEARQNVVRIQL